MKTLFTFILGMLSGWLIEWLIDYFQWHRKPKETGMEPTRPAVRTPAPPPLEPDDLKVIKGIGVVIERKLNEAGLFTFRQLATLSPDDLRGILGKSIQRLANEDSILHQARDLARKKQA